MDLQFSLLCHDGLLPRRIVSVAFLIPFRVIHCRNLNFFFLFVHSSDATLLVRGCNQLGQFLSHRETNLRYLALESLCLLATSEFSHDSVKKHQETVINALKVKYILAITRNELTIQFSFSRRNGMYRFVNGLWISCMPCATRATPKRLSRKC